MSVVMNVNEAKNSFSSILAEVEEKSSTITIIRYGRPIARIVPVTRDRDVSPMKELAGKVKMRGDWFAEDDAAEWENA